MCIRVYLKRGAELTVIPQFFRTCIIIIACYFCEHITWFFVSSTNNDTQRVCDLLRNIYKASHYFHKNQFLADCVAMRTYVLDLLKPSFRYPHANLELRTKDIANFDVRGTAESASSCSPAFILPIAADLDQKSKDLLAVEGSKTQEEIKVPFSGSHQIKGQPLRDEPLLPPQKRGRKRAAPSALSPKAPTLQKKKHKSKSPGPFRISSA